MYLHSVAAVRSVSIPTMIQTTYFVILFHFICANSIPEQASNNLTSTHGIKSFFNIVFYVETKWRFHWLANCLSYRLSHCSTNSLSYMVSHCCTNWLPNYYLSASNLLPLAHCGANWNLISPRNVPWGMDRVHWGMFLLPSHRFPSSLYSGKK